MAENKRYYWLKMYDDFFGSKRIKKLRRLAGGDTFTIIYLKMQLKSLKTGGYLEHTGIEGSFEEEIALDIDEDVENVRITVSYLMSVGLLEETDESTFCMPYVAECTGSESAGTQRVREHRARKNALSETKSNAERQRSHRAKKSCEEKQHVPFIEDYINNKRYGGNYYIVIKRDKYKCAICGSIENLCVHHIDGYDEKAQNNNAENKMVTLCRCCHSNVHAGKEIPSEILDSIDYFIDSNEMLPCNTNETQMKRVGNAEIEKEIDTRERDREYSAPDFDFEKAWEITFNDYPKKSAPAVAKQIWMDKILGVVPENQIAIVEIIYKATKAYLAYYEEKNPGDKDHRYIPKYSEWLKDDCDYWISVVEKGERE